jgi:ADP-ribose pyrophosphatase YjhB (NUDIX family)
MSEPARHRRVRVLALGVIEHPESHAVLVSEGYDEVRGERFHRLLGGGVKFGERGEDALKRELDEEIGAEVRVGRFLGAIENIFTYQGQPGHEVTLIFEASFTAPELYARQRFDGLETDPVDAIWRDSATLQSELPLYPRGALELARRGFR